MQDDEDDGSDNSWRDDEEEDGDDSTWETGEGEEESDLADDHEEQSGWQKDEDASGDDQWEVEDPLLPAAARVPQAIEMTAQLRATLTSLEGSTVRINDMDYKIYAPAEPATSLFNFSLLTLAEVVLRPFAYIGHSVEQSHKTMAMGGIAMTCALLSKPCVVLVKDLHGSVKEVAEKLDELLHGVSSINYDNFYV